jgi:hypothetical protein
MTADKIFCKSRNNKDRRSGLDRRHFSYSCHIPERRFNEEEQEDNKDRRCGSDRRAREEQPTESATDQHTLTETYIIHNLISLDLPGRY